MPKKSPTKDEKAHIASVAGLCCILAAKWGHECGGRLTVHHAIGVEFRGMGQKASAFETMCLCSNHHQHSRNAIHLMGKRAWEAKYSTQRELIEETLRKIRDGGDSNSF